MTATPSPERVRVDLRDVDAVPPDRAAVGRVEPREELGERRLAGPVLADERDDLAGVDLERHVDERGLRCPSGT